MSNYEEDDSSMDSDDYIEEYSGSEHTESETEEMEQVPELIPNLPESIPMPEVVHDAEFWKADGGEKYKKKEYLAAIGSYTKAIELEPTVAVYYTNRAAAHMMLLNYKEAVLDCERGIQLDKTNSRAYFRKATALKGLGNLDLAIATYKEGFEHDTSNTAQSARNEMNALVRAKEKLEGIKDLISTKRYSNALTHINMILSDIGSNFRDVLLLKLDCLIELKRYEESINLSNSLMKNSVVGSGDVTLLQLRAKCLYKMGELESAIKHLQMCIRADPENASIIKMYKFYRSVDEAKSNGTKAFLKSDWQEAISEWTKCIELDPRNVNVIAKLYFNRGTAHAKLSHFETSIVDCTKAIQCDSKYTKAYVRRADSHLAIPSDPVHIQQAISDLEKAYELYSQQSEDESQDENKIKAEMKSIKAKIQKSKVALKRSKRVDLYGIIGVSQNATEAEIKKAYKKKALIYHPDRNSNKSEKEKADNETTFKKINEAYEILTDAQKKKLYDEGVEVEDLDQAVQQGSGRGFSSRYEEDDDDAGGYGGGGFGGGRRGHGGGMGGMDPNDIFRMYMNQQR